MTDTRMYDDALTLQDVLRLFIATNYDVQAGDTDNENPADELVRYEFVEILVRIAD